jgi:3-deoxy-alpha-D-manno-octulosonate 8-oxidase
VDVTQEPKTRQVDGLAAESQAEFGEVSGIIGIGGGSDVGFGKGGFING